MNSQRSFTPVNTSSDSDSSEPNGDRIDDGNTSGEECLPLYYKRHYYNLGTGGMNYMSDFFDIDNLSEEEIQELEDYYFITLD